MSGAVAAFGGNWQGAVRKRAADIETILKQNQSEPKAAHIRDAFQAAKEGCARLSLQLNGGGAADWAGVGDTVSAMRQSIRGNLCLATGLNDTGAAVEQTLQFRLLQVRFTESEDMSTSRLLIQVLSQAKLLLADIPSAELKSQQRPARDPVVFTAAAREPSDREVRENGERIFQEMTALMEDPMVAQARKTLLDALEKACKIPCSANTSIATFQVKFAESAATLRSDHLSGRFDSAHLMQLAVSLRPIRDPSHLDQSFKASAPGLIEELRSVRSSIMVNIGLYAEYHNDDFTMAIWTMLKDPAQPEKMRLGVLETLTELSGGGRLSERAKIGIDLLRTDYEAHKKTVSKAPEGN